MANKKQEQTAAKGIKKVQTFFSLLILCNIGTLTGRCIRVYRDYKAHPAFYTAPYPTWQEQLEFDFIFCGIVILICIIALIILKIIQHKSVITQ